MTDNQSNYTGQPQADTGNGSPGTVNDPHLAEFDRATTRPTQGIPQELAPVIRFAESKMIEEVKATIDKEVESAISTLTADEAFKGTPKRLARGFLEAWAIENPEFKQAFEQRKSNPKGWEKALSDASTGFAEDMGKMPGNSVRSDVEAARAAVRGTSSAPPPKPRQKSAPELRNMSDQEFRRYKAQLAAGH